MNSDVVCPFCHFVVTKHIEATLVIVGCLQIATPSKCNIIACARIHQQTYLCIWRRIDFQSHSEVTAVVVVNDGSIARFSRYIRSSPFYEFLTGDNLWTGSIVDVEGVLLWCDVCLDDSFVLPSVNSGFALCEYCSVERVFTKIRKIICQQVLGVYIDVECQVGQFLMVDAARHHSLITVNVVNGAVDEFYLVGYHADSVITHFIGTP